MRENEGMIQPSAMEWTLLQLFQQVPPHQQKDVLEVLRWTVKIARETDKRSPKE